MRIKLGKGTTQLGTGVVILLRGSEVKEAIEDFLKKKGVKIDGAKTIGVNGELCVSGSIHVNPPGSVIQDGVKWDGRGIVSASPK